MRVLFVNEKCGFFGGVEQNVHEAATGLAERGHDVSLACSEVTSRDGAGYRRPFRAVARASGAAALAGVVDRLDPHVIYVHRVGRVRDVVEAARGRPVVRMIHDHDVYCPRRHKYHALGGQVCTRAAGWACWLDLAFLERAPGSAVGFRWSSIPAKMREMEDNRELGRVIVASRYMREQLVLNGFDEARIEVVAPAVRGAVPGYAPPPSGGRILYVGQLVRGKGVDLLLDAVADLPGSWVLDVVGEGSARPGLEAHVQARGLGARVLFAGWRSLEELRDIYHRANVVVVPSRWPEPFGMVGLEAMRAGRPVVGFAAGGIPDWLVHGRTGVLVPPGDVSALSAGIARLLAEPPVAMEMGREAQQVVRDLFSFERMLDSLEEILGFPAAAVRVGGRAA